MSGDHVAPNHEIDDPNKPRREKHTPLGLIRRPMKLPEMVPIKDAVATSDEPGGYDVFDSDEDYLVDELLGDELAKVEEQIG